MFKWSIYDGFVIHLDPEILDSEVKWALESIIINKASEDDGITAEVFQILEVDFVTKCLVYQVFGKLSSGHRTGKDQFSFQSQRRGVPKNVQITIQLYLFHMIVRLCSKSFKPGFSSR